MRIKKLDHLLRRLRARIFTEIAAELPLRFRRGLPEQRSDIVGEDPQGWAAVGPDLVWGEPESYFWFATRFAMPQAANGQRVFLKVNAQFGNTRGRSDPQCLVRVNGRIAQGADGNFFLINGGKNVFCDQLTEHFWCALSGPGAFQC